MNWLLPEYIADALPAEAERIERLRRTLLDHFRSHGFEFVMPPMLEYLESLLTGAGQDLNLRTFKLVDQLTGRTMGVRADITPQSARIDAHLLNHRGVTRLCYCDSVLHAMPASISASREPVQIGAELYGHAGIAADITVIRLLAGALKTIKVPVSRIDLGHVGIFRALAEAACLPQEAEGVVLDLLQAKDVPGLVEACADVPSPFREALQRLPQLYGGVEVLDRVAAHGAQCAGRLLPVRDAGNRKVAPAYLDELRCRVVDAGQCGVFSQREGVGLYGGGGLFVPTYPDASGSGRPMRSLLGL